MVRAYCREEGRRVSDYPCCVMPQSKRRTPKYSGPTQSKRPQKAAAKDPSPAWYVAIMFGLMALGVVLVVLRYVLQWDNMVLILGLVAIAGGFLMTTNFR